MKIRPACRGSSRKSLSDYLKTSRIRPKKPFLGGGAGADRFVYATAGWGADTVADFEDGVDRLDFTGSGLTFADLTVTAGTAGTTVSVGTSSILLAGVDAGLIDGSDFIFG